MCVRDLHPSVPWLTSLFTNMKSFPVLIASAVLVAVMAAPTMAQAQANGGTASGATSSTTSNAVSASADSVLRVFHACFNRSSGTVYRVREPGLPAACFANATAFTWTDGVGARSGVGSATWHGGEAMPAMTVGVPGDFYLNATTGEVYRKSADQWMPQGNLKGPKGDVGAQGLPGVAGVAGDRKSVV